MVTLLTRSGSSYSIDDSGLLLRKGKQVGKPDNPIHYMGLVNTFQFQMHGERILPDFFEYESPQGIKQYIESCPPEAIIIRNLEEGMAQSYMVQLVGISQRSIDGLKKEFQFEANSMPEFVDTLIERIELERPADKVAVVPYDLVTSVLTSVR